MTIIQYYRITVFRVEVFPTYHPLFHYFDIHPRPMAIHPDFRVFSSVHPQFDGIFLSANSLLIFIFYRS